MHAIKVGSERHFSQKRLWLETQNGLFSLHHQTTPYETLNRGPPVLYWLGTSGWCSGGPCVLVPLSFVFVFFHSHAITAMSRSAICLFCLCLSSTKRSMDFWVCLIYSHSLMGLHVCFA